MITRMIHTPPDHECTHVWCDLQSVNWSYEDELEDVLATACQEHTSAQDSIPDYLRSYTDKLRGPYNLLSLSARVVARRVTRADIDRLPEELHNLVQSYVPWWRQLGIFNPLREWRLCDPSPGVHRAAPSACWDNALTVLSRETHVTQIPTADWPHWVEHGDDREWFANGQLAWHTEVVHDEIIRKRAWSVRGIPISDISYRHGLIDGVHREWFFGGNVLNETHYRRNVKHGIVREYDIATGLATYEAEFCNGLLHGTMYVCTSDGALETRRQFRNGLLHGLTLLISTSGGHTYTAECWHEGKLVAHRRIVATPIVVVKCYPEAVGLTPDTAKPVIIPEGYTMSTRVIDELIDSLQYRDDPQRFLKATLGPDLREISGLYTRYGIGYDDTGEIYSGA